MDDSNKYLLIENLSKTYKGNDFKSLDNLSLSLSPGIYGILGANGAGKSTFFNILTGLIPQSEGSIYYKGEDVSEDIEKFKGHIGYMPQNQALYPSYTLERFLTYIGTLKGLGRKDIKDEVTRVLEVTELLDLRKRKISSLSGGMKQRLLISQALIKDPDILILDEPTAGLDPKQRIAIRNFLSKISADKIVLISTHVVSDIEHISKEIIIIKEGKLILKDTPENILKEYENIAFEAEIEASKVKYFLDHTNVSQMQIRANGLNYIKITGDFDNPPIIEGVKFEKAKVDLEDVYLYLFEGDKNA